MQAESRLGKGDESKAAQPACCTEGLLLLVPPHPELFSPTQFAQLAKPLGGFILATANFSAIRGEPGPTAPLAWMRDALGRLGADAEPEALPKLMATLPLLGWDFTLPSGPKAPVDSQRYLELLEEHDPKLDWHAEAAEHVFAYRGGGAENEKHSVYYPSLKGLAERLGMLRALGVGVAVWELGTGLDYFWDLL